MVLKWVGVALLVVACRLAGRYMGPIPFGYRAYASRWEAADDRSPGYRCNSSVHGMLFSSFTQALPVGNSNSFRDAGFISAE